MLGAPAHPDGETAGRTGRPGVAVGLCRTAAGSGDVVFVEASRKPGFRGADPDRAPGGGRAGVRATALSWLRTNAGRYGLDPAFHRDAAVHLHVQSGAGPTEGASAGVTMAAALVSAFTGRPVRDDLAMTGETTLSGQVLRVGGIEETVARGAPLRAWPRRPAAGEPPAGRRGPRRRRGPKSNYVTQVVDLLELALRPAPPAAEVAAAMTPAGRVS